MTDKERLRFIDSIQRDYGAINRMLGKISSRRSQSFKPEDKTRIFQVVEEVLEGGFTQMDRMLLTVLQTRLELFLVAAIRELMEAPSPDT